MRFFYFYIVLFFLWELPLALALEDGGSIRGVVQDKNNSNRLDKAIIHLKKGKKTILLIPVSETGEFVVEGIDPDVYDLECAADGYITQRIVGLEIRPDKVKLAYFYLTAGNAKKNEVEEIFTHAAIQARLAATTSTASKTEESAANAPATMYIITQEDIFENGYNSLVDVLETIPGIEVNTRASSESYNILTVRGIWGNNKVLILFNGIRFNSSSSDLMTIGENFNIKDVSRVEVLLGPASAVYGADAFSAVVNIISETGAKNKGGGVSAGYGMYQTTNATFWGGGGNKDISFMVNGSMHWTLGPNLYKQEAFSNSFAWYNDHYSKDGTMLANPFTTELDTVEIKPFMLPTAAYSVCGQFRWKGLELGVLHNSEAHSSSAGVRPQYSLYWDKTQFGYSTTTAYLRHNWTSPKEKVRLESSIQWNSYKINKYSNFANVFSGYEKVYKYALTNGSRIEENVSWNISKQHQLMAGVLLQHSYIIPKTSDLPQRYGGMNQPAEEQDLYYIGTDVTDENGNSLKMYQNIFRFNRLVAGAFAQYRFNIQDKFFLTLGVRYDHAFDLYGKDIQANADEQHRKMAMYNGISPRLSIVYRPIPALGIKLFAGRAFLAPSGQAKFDHYGSFFPVTDAIGHTALQAGFWQLPNPELKAEIMNSGEFAIDYTKGNFSVIANGFFNYGQNLIKRDFHYSDTGAYFMGINVPAYSRNANEKGMMSYGGSIQALYRFILGKQENTQIQLSANYTYIGGVFQEIDDEEEQAEEEIESFRLPFTAHHTAKMGVLFRYKDMVVSANGLYRSGSANEGFENSAGQLIQIGNPAYFRLNLYAAYRFMVKRTQMNFFVRVLNATNAKYYNTAENLFGNFTASPQNPIAVFGGIQVNFAAKSK